MARRNFCADQFSQWQDPLGVSAADYLVTENHARQVRGDRCHRQGAQAQQREDSHCVVIHFVAHPPSKFSPKGVVACRHAEWEESRAMAERKATRWRKERSVEAIEILEVRQV